MKNVNNSKDLRQQQLIEATIKTISTHGLSKTTVARVTKQANLSAGIVGFYFNSKEQLLLGTLQWLTEEITDRTQSAFETSKDPRQALEAVIDTYLSDELCDADKIAVWYAFASESGARQEYMDICGEYDIWFHKNLLKQVQMLCKKTNQKLSQRRLIALSRGLEGLIDGYWQEFLYQPDQFDRLEAKKICYEYLHSIAPSSELNHSTTNPVLNPTLQTSDCLAPWVYNDAEFLQLEKQELFRKNWLLVGHVNEIPNPRNYLTLDAVGERALVVRGNDNVIRAFHNVCRHRGAKLFEKSNGECAHMLTCPFHGWTYQLDGKLIGIPAEHTFDGIDKNNHGLVPLDMEIWMGFIFVQFEKPEQSLAEIMKPLEASFAPYLIEQMQPMANTRTDEILPYNWKVIHDIDNEGYHVPIGHPSLQQLYGKTYTDNKIEGVATGYISEQPAKAWSVRHYQNLLPHYDHLPEDNQRLWYYGSIFPNTVFGLYPDCIEFYMTIPLDIDRTLLRCGIYALDDSRREAKAARYLNRRINSTTSEEDESFVRTMQHGMQSSVFPEPTLSSLESGVREFHHRIQQKLPVAKLKNHPGQGQVDAFNSELGETISPG